MISATVGSAGYRLLGESANELMGGAFSTLIGGRPVVTGLVECAAVRSFGDAGGLGSVSSSAVAAEFVASATVDYLTDRRAPRRRPPGRVPGVCDGFGGRAVVGELVVISL